MLARSAARSANSSEANLVYTVAARYDGNAWLRGADRFPQGARILLGTGSSARPLIPSFFATADPATPFDATHVLFAGKRTTTEKWQIWEAALTGGEPFQITACDDDCVRPFYLPEDRFVYARRVGDKFVLEVSTRDRKVNRLTSIPGNVFPTDVLRDGRILLEAGDPLGSDTAAEIYTVYSDGSGVESYRCDHGNARHSGKQLVSGDIVFANEHGLGRFTSALAHQAEVNVAPGEYAGDVIEYPNADWLVSTRPGPRAAFELQRRNVASGAQSTVVAVSGNDVVQPLFLAPRPVPNRHPSALHDWDGANLLCLNAYTSRHNIAPGSIATMRLYTRSSQGEAVLLGNSPVEKDGSFFLHVPADQPLQMELLDHAGATLQREHGWFWMKRGEQRVCVGCHAGPERAPENAVPAVLLRSTDPVDMTKSATHQQGVQ